MKALAIKISLICLLLSCKNHEPNKNSRLQEKKDSPNAKVEQPFSYGETDFDFSEINDLKHNKSYDRFLAGQLNLITGQLVCTDPMIGALAFPQTWSVPKGQYPVYLYIGLNEDFAGRVAYAELVIKDEVPEFWEASLIPEQFLDTIESKLNALYPVESGLSSFSDFATFRIFEQEIEDFYSQNKSGDYYNDILEKHFQVNKNVPRSSRGEDWINYQPEKAEGNIIMFGSGMGDGLYPRYVGRAKNGEVVKFVTVFILSG